MNKLSIINSREQKGIISLRNFFLLLDFGRSGLEIVLSLVKTLHTCELT